MATQNNAIFSGNSRFSADFQAVIDRAVAIASLPLNQLNDVKSNLSDQSTALSDLDSHFTSLQNSLTTLSNATGTGSYSASVSDPTILSATVGTGVMPGTYTVEVTNLGALTTTMSTNTLLKVSDPTASSISTSSSYTLTVNGTPYTLNPAANTLNALVKAINGAGAPVTATVVNVGSSSAPDYRLSVQGTQLESDTIQINDGTQNLLSPLATGANATYKVNGMVTPVSSTSRSVTLAPGLTVNLLAQSATGVATTITVSQNSTGVQNALNSFINLYNSTVDDLAKQYGSNGGKLAGQSIVSILNGALQDLGSYTTTSGKITSATALGLTFDKTGHLSLDQTTFGALAPADVMTFLGSPTGGGFLKAATDTLNGLEDPDNGILKTAISSIQSRMTTEDQLISQKQDSIDKLRQSMQAQMSAADALIASLEQQVNYMTGMFDSMRVATESLK